MSRQDNQEVTVARQAAPDPLQPPTGPSETLVDYMADAPKERPYSEAVSDEHRKVLEASKERR